MGILSLVIGCGVTGEKLDETPVNGLQLVVGYNDRVLAHVGPARNS